MKRSVLVLQLQHDLWWLRLLMLIESLEARMMQISGKGDQDQKGTSAWTSLVSKMGMYWWYKHYVNTWHQRWQNVKVPEEFPELPRSYAFFPAGGSVVTYYLDSTKSRCYSTKHPLRSNHKGYGAGIFLMFGLKIKKDIINNLNNHKILNHLKKTKKHVQYWSRWPFKSKEKPCFWNWRHWK